MLFGHCKVCSKTPASEEKKNHAHLWDSGAKGTYKFVIIHSTYEQFEETDHELWENGSATLGEVE